MNPELIKCLKSFIRSKHLTNEWNIFRDNWFKSINSEASNESLSVRDNEGQKNNCPFCESTNTKIKYEPVGKCNNCNKDWAI